MQQSIELWDIFEISMEGTKEGNPFLEVEVKATFMKEDQSIEVLGFYDGNGTYKIRFMPRSVGRWSYETSSNCEMLHGITGTFECVEAKGKNHGPVRVKDTYHFEYEDGTPHYSFGTTCYAWTHQGDALEEKTLETLRSAPFNKIRMCVFPKHYIFNENEPIYYPFEGSKEDGWDFTRFEPEFFRHFEKRVGQLRELGIEADIILFHPYDEGHWGFDQMEMEVNLRYLKYLFARLSAYRNVWWSMANEYDLMKKLSMEDWNTLIESVAKEDPYGHLISIHNCSAFFDHTNPLISHASIQRQEMKLITEWRKQFKKPIVIDECCYEGDIPYIWGELTEQEMTNRFWEGTLRGGYVGHGETYLDSEDILWWSKGGTLHGKSPDRIAFLRKLIESIPKDCHEPVIYQPAWENTACIGKEGEFYLAYFGIYRPGKKILELPEGHQYQIDLIDTWEMTITRVPKVFEAHDDLILPGKPYMAVRIQRI